MSAYDNLVREHAALQTHNCQLGDEIRLLNETNAQYKAAQAEIGTAAREIAVLHAQLTELTELSAENASLRRDVATVRRQRDEENSLRVDHHCYAERKIAELRARIATLEGNAGLQLQKGTKQDE